jgi:hypothetical protein
MGLAHAASISFTPPGLQLDSDLILDKTTASGADNVFEVMLDTTGLPDCTKNPGACLGKLDYAITYDRKELVLQPIMPGTGFAMNLYFPGACPAPAVPPVEQICNVNAVHDQGSIPSGTMLLLDTVDLIATDFLDNDGHMDFGINLLTATSVGGDDYAPLFLPVSQIIEVQPCEMNGGGNALVCVAASVPEPLTLSSSGLALCIVGALLKLRSTS